MAPVESTTTAPSTGLAARLQPWRPVASPASAVAAISVACVAARAVGRRTGAVGDGVGLVDGAVLEAGRDRVGIHGLVDHDALVGQRLRARAVRQQVGAHRGVDRRHDVGVQGDGEVDGCGPVDGQVDVRREVEDRDDLLVRHRSHPLGRQFLRSHRCEFVGAHRVSLICTRHRAGRFLPAGPMPPAAGRQLRARRPDASTQLRANATNPYPGGQGPFIRRRISAGAGRTAVTCRHVLRARQDRRSGAGSGARPAAFRLGPYVPDRPLYDAGTMLLFRRKKLSGSYCALISSRRWRFALSKALSTPTVTASSATPVKFRYSDPVPSSCTSPQAPRTHEMTLSSSARVLPVAVHRHHPVRRPLAVGGVLDPTRLMAPPMRNVTTNVRALGRLRALSTMMSRIGSVSSSTYVAFQ